MSKKAIGIIVAVVIVVVAIVLAAVAGLLVLLREKESVTAAEFKKMAEEAGYTVVEATEQFSDTKAIEKVYIALADGKAYQIEFYDIDTVENAQGFFANNQANFASSGGNYVNVNGRNYAKYSASADGKYKLLSQINDTVIFVNTESEHKDAVQELLDTLGY